MSQPPASPPADTEDLTEPMLGSDSPVQQYQEAVAQLCELYKKHAILMGAPAENAAHKLSEWKNTRQFKLMCDTILERSTTMFANEHKLEYRGVLRVIRAILYARGSFEAVAVKASTRDNYRLEAARKLELYFRNIVNGPTLRDACLNVIDTIAEAIRGADRRGDHGEKVKTLEETNVALRKEVDTLKATAADKKAVADLADAAEAKFRAEVRERSQR